MDNNKNIIDIEDYRGKRIIFTYKKWKQKSITHPELCNKIFLKNLKETIRKPEEVWQDYSDKKCKRCYYKKYSVNSYVKVIIWTYSNPCHVITAFETNQIKEVQYPKLKPLL